MFFADFSYAFKTIAPSRLVTKLTRRELLMQNCRRDLDKTSTICHNKVHIYPTMLLSHGVSQGCALSYLRYKIKAFSVRPYPSNMIIKFADDTKVNGLISGGYRSGIEIRTAWNSKNNLSSKTNELLMEFGRSDTAHVPLVIGVDSMESVDKIRFLRMCRRSLLD